MSNKKDLLPCEVVLSQRKFPDQKDKILNAYKLRDKYKKLYEDINKIKNKLNYKLVDHFESMFNKLEDKVNLLESFSPKFIPYLTTSKAHHKKLSERLASAFSECSDQDQANKELEQLTLISSDLTKLGLPLNTAVKNILKLRDCRKEIVELRTHLSLFSQDPKKDFRYLYKNIEN